MAEDFNKRLKTDRIKLFVDVVTKMANDTPAGGYAIGEAIGSLPDNLKQFLLSEIPDKIIRAEYSRRGLGNLEDACVTQGNDELIETFRSEIYNNNKLHTIADLLGTDCLRPDLVETAEALVKLFPERWTIEELSEEIYARSLGL